MKEGKLILIEKYNDFLDYIYPTTLYIPNKHKDIKIIFLRLIFEQVDLLYKAVKTTQVSKMYEADSGLHTLRYQLRFLSDKKRRLISRRRAGIAMVKLSEVGKILGAMMATAKGK